MFQGLREILLSGALKPTMSEVMSGHLECLASGGKQNAPFTTISKSLKIINNTYTNAKRKKRKHNHHFLLKVTYQTNMRKNI